MNRWSVVGALILAMGSLSTPARGAEPIEYRTITMIDGSVHRGVVVASDADTMRIKTLHGEISLPLGDVVGVDSISREMYLTEEGRKVIFLGVAGPADSTGKAHQIESIAASILSEGAWLVVRPPDLPEARRKKLAACPTPGCWVEAVRSESLPSLYGQLEHKDGKDRVVLRRFARNGEQSAEVSLVVAEPRSERERLSRSIALVMGDTPAAPPHPVVEGPLPDNRKGEPQAAAKTPGPSTGPTTDTTARPSTGPNAGSSANQTASAPAASRQPSGNGASQASSPSGAPGATTSTGTPAATGKAKNDAAVAKTSPTTTPAGSGTGSKAKADTGSAPVAKSGTGAGSSGQNGATPTSAGPGRAGPDATKTEPTVTARASVPATPGDPDSARVRKLEWMPLPGASSLIVDHDVPAFALSAGIVTVFTGAVVYLSGDMRTLGVAGGMSVPWTYDERAGRDAALLTGVGVVSYVASTWIVNHIVGRVTHHRHTGAISAY